MAFEEDEAFGRAVVDSGGTLEDVLQHYGVPGMKWGRRRTREQLARARSAPDAEEHTRARQLHTVAKAGGTRKLSNKDLQDLNTRLNLEQNYRNLTTKTTQKGKVATGSAWLGKKVVKIGDTALDEVTKAHLRVELHKKGLLPQVKDK